MIDTILEHARTADLILKPMQDNYPILVSILLYLSPMIASVTLPFRIMDGTIGSYSSFRAIRMAISMFLAANAYYLVQESLSLVIAVAAASWLLITVGNWIARWGHPHAFEHDQHGYVCSECRNAINEKNLCFCSMWSDILMTDTRTRRMAGIGGLFGLESSYDVDVVAGKYWMRYLEDGVDAILLKKGTSRWGTVEILTGRDSEGNRTRFHAGERIEANYVFGKTQGGKELLYVYPEIASEPVLAFELGTQAVPVS